MVPLSIALYSSALCIKDYIYTMEYYVAERKKEVLPLVTTWRELENIMLSEVSQSVKDKYHMISLIRGI